jgi:glycosyltransferase involved in cell wall biosynthesis
VNRTKPLNVFFDDSIFHVQPIGGISRYVMNLVAALAATERCRVTLFSGWSPVKIPVRLRRMHNLRIFHLPRPTGWRVNTMAARVSGVWRRAIFRLVRRTGEDQVYHPSFYTFDPFIAGSADAMVVTFHDMIAELFPEPSERSARHLEQKISASEQADGILTVSRSTFNDLVRLQPWTSDKTTITHLATALIASHQSPSLKWPERVTGYFLMVGNRDDYKNGTMAISAFKEFSKRQNTETFGLVMCGGKPLGKDEMQMLTSSGLQGRVILTSPTDEELESLYTHATALLYPSRYEGFGLPVLEAMACGCPVITTKASSLPEVGGEACVYVDPDDFRQIADAMQHLASDPQFRSRTVLAGSEQSKIFSWARCAQETITAYSKALRSRKSTEPFGLGANKRG